MRFVAYVLLATAACGGSSSHHTGSDAADPDTAAIDAAIDVPGDGIPDASVSPSGVGGPPVGECHEEWCWVLPLPQGDPIVAVGAPAANDVWSLTNNGTLYHYNGSAWSQFGARGEFKPGGGGAWGMGGSFVGTANDLYMTTPNRGTAHWDGTAWGPARGGTIGVISPTNVWAVDSGTSSQWDGTQWIDHPGPGFTPLAVGGTGTTVLAISSTGTIAQWLGTAWGTSEVGTHSGNAAVVIDATHIVVAPTGGNVAFWDAGTWTTHPLPVAANAQKIVAGSPTDVWIATFGGANGEHRYHWNGTAWSAADDLGTNAGATSIFEAANGDLYASLGDSQVRRWDGASWSALTFGSNAIKDVWGTAPTDLWAIGSTNGNQHHAFHWDGTAWTDVAFPFSTDYTLGRMWGSGASDIWIGASRSISFSTIQRTLFHWNGIAWSEDGPYGTEDGIATPYAFIAIWGTAADNIYAVDKSSVYHRSASGWTPIAGLPGGSDVFGSGADDVYVVNGTTLWHWNGTAWSSKTTPAAFDRGWSNSATDVWLSGISNDAMYHYDGTFFVDLQPTRGMPLGTAAEMWTIDYSNLVMTKWTGGFTGTKTAKERFFTGYSSWVAPDGHFWVAGNGLLVH